MQPGKHLLHVYHHDGSSTATSGLTEDQLAQQIDVSIMAEQQVQDQVAAAYDSIHREATNGFSLGARMLEVVQLGAYLQFVPHLLGGTNMFSTLSSNMRAGFDWLCSCQCCPVRIEVAYGTR